jgi:hypothetical protein
VLGCAECDDLEGKPLFFFHGIPGSPRQARLGDAAAKKLGVRIIACGDQEPHPNLTG